jgi:hypothetical protein
LCSVTEIHANSKDGVGIRNGLDSADNVRAPAVKFAAELCDERRGSLGFTPFERLRYGCGDNSGDDPDR